MTKFVKEYYRHSTSLEKMLFTKDHDINITSQGLPYIKALELVNKWNRQVAIAPSLVNHNIIYFIE
jgi:hypothetical protein